MNKKIFFIPVAVGLLVFILISIFKKDPEVGNKFVAEVPVHNTSVENIKIKEMTLYADFSGSMRGFVDFSLLGKDVQNNFISTTTNFLDNVESKFGFKSTSYIGNRKYSKDEFRGMLRNCQGFNANVTLLHEIFAKALTTTSDSTLSVIVSDMVLSFGKRELLAKHDTAYNQHQLNALGSEIHSVMSSLKSKKMDVIILQYLSSFNGRYYCNCTENLKGNLTYQNKHMKNRPYYIAIMGSQNALKSILDQNLIAESNNIYSSFEFDSHFKSEQFVVKVKDKDPIWNVGDSQEGNNQLMGTLWSQNDWGEAPSTLHLECRGFYIPKYLGSGELFADYSKDVIKDIHNISYSEKDGLSCDVNIVDYNKLPKECTADFNFYKSNDWANNVTVLNDVDQDLTSLEGKTWGFSTITEYTDKAYFSKGRESKVLVGKFSFNFLKK